MSDKSRLAFESWLGNDYEWGNEAINSAVFSGDDETGYYVGGTYTFDGRECCDALFWAWRGWQASRAAGLKVKGES